ncbi:MAG: PepSY-associated TM helix domain-containing protein [Xenophilus sp.]
MRESPWRLRYEQIFIDDQTGALLAQTGYDSGTRGDKVLIWQYPLHSGRILGPWGRALVFALGIAAHRPARWRWPFRHAAARHLHASHGPIRRTPPQRFRTHLASRGTRPAPWQTRTSPAWCISTCPRALT